MSVIIYFLIYLLYRLVPVPILCTVAAVILQHVHVPEEADFVRLVWQSRDIASRWQMRE